MIHLLGFLAGTMTRLVVKDPTSVEKHIITLAKDRFASVFGLNYLHPHIDPPNTGCYDV